METTQDGNQTISLDSMSMNQFAALKQQMEGEVQALSEHVSSLRQAVSRLTEMHEAINQLNIYMERRSENEESDILVPLTSSVYVKGKLKCDRQVLVDIGTGYMVQKSCATAKKDEEKKLSMVTQQTAKIEKLLQEKQKNLEVLVGIMRQKFVRQQLLAQQNIAAPSIQTK